MLIWVYGHTAYYLHLCKILQNIFQLHCSLLYLFMNMSYVHCSTALLELIFGNQFLDYSFSWHYHYHAVPSQNIPSQPCVSLCVSYYTPSAALPCECFVHNQAQSSSLSQKALLRCAAFPSPTLRVCLVI